MALEWIRRLALAAIGLHVLYFLDAPFLTFGQKPTAWRWREQVLIMSVELDFLLLWAMAKWYLHRDWGLVLPPFEVALAGGGVVLTLAGVGLFVWAKLRLGPWFAAGFMVKQGHQLVSDGPYAIVRHPIYTGVLAVFVGASLVWNSVLTLMLAALFSITLFLHSAVEEALFEQHFGEAYRAYQRRVPRMAPWPRPPTSMQ